MGRLQSILCKVKGHQVYTKTATAFHFDTFTYGTLKWRECKRCGKRISDGSYLPSRSTD